MESTCFCVGIHGILPLLVRLLFDLYYVVVDTSIWSAIYVWYECPSPRFQFIPISSFLIDDLKTYVLYCLKKKSTTARYEVVASNWHQCSWERSRSTGHSTIPDSPLLSSPLLFKPARRRALVFSYLPAFSA